MKLNIYTLIFLVLAIGSSLVISNVLLQEILGTVLAIVFLIVAGITTKQKKGNSRFLNLHFLQLWCITRTAVMLFLLKVKGAIQEKKCALSLCIVPFS